MGGQQEQHQPDDRTPGVADKAVEGCDEIGCRLPGKTVGSRFADKLKRPSCHNGVISQNKESGQYAHTSYPAPMRAGCQFLISPCRIGTRAPADEEFCNHDGDAENEHANQVYKDKCRTSVIPGLKRETPDVT